MFEDWSFGLLVESYSYKTVWFNYTTQVSSNIHFRNIEPKP